jgi:amino-acid N-acetyltransferase
LDEILVRPAVRNDISSIRALIHDVRINPIGLNWSHFLIVETVEGLLLGCGQIKRHSDGSLELASIAVRENARGRGIARKIIETLLVQESKRPLFLMCRARLGQMYQKFGFKAAAFTEMPPYFRHIRQVERILNRTAEADDRLLVMKLDN